MKETTLLVTDSGLGGLSVLAAMANGYAKTSRFDRVNLIYFNSWPEQYKGYNHYPVMADRAKVFNQALRAMAGYTPDAIYIACNTLSVFYPMTEFAQTTAIPVTGIVEHGVDQMAKKLGATPTACAVVFGTPTTIEGASHKDGLTAKGVDPNRIIAQGCLNLAGKIERDPFGDEVKQLIDENTKAAAAQMPKNCDTLYAALCCTHFGYCKDAFKADLERHSGVRVEILNPNEEMAAQACKDQDESGAPEINIEIFSRVTWEDSRIAAYERLLSPVSMATVKALKNYTLDRELFTIPTLEA